MTTLPTILVVLLVVEVTIICTHISIKSEPMIDTTGYNNHVTSGHGNTDPLILAVSHIKVTRAVKDKPVICYSILHINANVFEDVCMYHANTTELILIKLGTEIAGDLE